MLRGGLSEHDVRALRHALGIRPVYKTVDTCAAEFAARTPYHYSSYDEETEVAPQRPADGASSWAAGRTGSARASSSTTPACTPAIALRDAGFETVMVNCNPETVSTDYDTSDRLYFEPLTLEDVLEVVARRAAQPAPLAGVDRAARRPDPARPGAAAQGRRRPDRRAPRPRRSTWPRTAARSGRCSPRPASPRPEHGTAARFDEAARRSPTEIGYPVLVRPSYVLGGRGMEIVYDDATLRDLHRPGDRRSARSTRCWSTGSSTTRSRSTSTRSSTATSSTSAA